MRETDSPRVGVEGGNERIFETWQGFSLELTTYFRAAKCIIIFQPRNDKMQTFVKGPLEGMKIKNTQKKYPRDAAVLAYDSV